MLDSLASLTDTTQLGYLPSELVIRSYDGNYPPPLKSMPDKQIFFGFGITAYWLTSDTLAFFKLQSFEVVLRDAFGNEVRKFENGKTYTKDFRKFYLEELDPKEYCKLYLQKVYLKDKNSNMLKFEEPFLLCPHCYQ